MDVTAASQYPRQEQNPKQGNSRKTTHAKQLPVWDSEIENQILLEFDRLVFFSDQILLEFDRLVFFSDQILLEFGRVTFLKKCILLEFDRVTFL